MPHKDPAARRAYQIKNRARHNEYEKARRLRNIDAARARARELHAKNKEHHNQLCRESYARNTEKNRAYARAYYYAHKAEKQEYAAQFRLSHAAYLKTYYLAYARAHPDKMAEKHQRRRARMHGAQRLTLTEAQWREIKEAFDHRCAYCGRRMQRLEKDHITPVDNHGDYHVHNIVPACRRCNASKGTRPAPKLVQPLLLTIAPEHQPRNKKD